MKKMHKPEKICFLFGVLLLFAGIFAGCGKEKRTASEVIIYLPDENLTHLVEVGYEYQSNTLEEQVNELFSQLSSASADVPSRAVIGNGYKLMNWTISETGVLTCYFDAGYLKLSQTDEVLTRAAIVKTMCQREEILAVEFYVDNEPLILGGFQVGQMDAGMFISDIGMAKQEMKLMLYFANAEKTGLLETEYIMILNDYINKEQMVLEALLYGPVTEDRVQTIPKNTKINKVVTKDTICYVDLDQGFYEYLEEMPPDLTIYSIVNSLCELPSVNKVLFTVNGETPASYMNMDISQMFERNLDCIIKTEP